MKALVGFLTSKNFAMLSLGVSAGLFLPAVITGEEPDGRILPAITISLLISMLCVAVVPFLPSALRQGRTSDEGERSQH